MKRCAVLLALTVGACSQPTPSEPNRAERAAPDDATSNDMAPVGDIRTQFFGLVGKDPWANWPAELSEDPNDRGRSCLRVTDEMRQKAIDMLKLHPAIELDQTQYKRLTGAGRPPGGGIPYLLRAFSSANSFSRLKRSGGAVVVHTDPSGRLFNVRRHPCVAILNRKPSEVFTVAMYDL